MGVKCMSKCQATCSSPRQYQQVKANNMTVIVVNTQSIMAKKECLWQIIDDQRPDVILASETWLKSDIHDTEIIPADFGYELFRNDRSDGYGGVLIAVKRTLIYELTTVGKECEFIAVKITCKYNSLIVASLYRPTDNDSDYAMKLANAIESIVKDHPKDVVWIGGDINLPDINWSSNSISGNSYRKDINETILEVLAKFWFGASRRFSNEG